MPQTADSSTDPKGEGSATSRLPLRLTRPLVLVGLMGAGKTSVGKRLAAFLDVSFCDSDAEIETAADMPVSEIFERFGEAHFRDGERRVMARLLDNVPGVLATGGGAFASPEIRAMIRKKGVSIWIDAELETLWSRVKDRPTRPLLQRPDAKQALTDLLEARRPAYAEADIRVVSEHDIGQDVMVRRIVEAVVARDRAEPGREAVVQRAG